MKNAQKFLTLALVLAALLVTAKAALGMVVINEVMYSLGGSDTGHEWIELYNNGPNAEDLTDWGFYEASTNHGLTLGQGSFTLPLGGYAVITSDIDVFAQDHPSYAGTVLRSSFSLSDTGETIGLRDASSNAVGTDLAYSNDWNLGGEGYSLEKKDNTIDNNAADNWQTGIPAGTPGANNNDAPVANDDADSTNENAILTTVNVLDNDVDADAGDTKSVVSYDAASTRGTVTDNHDGTFTYNPNGQFEALAAGSSATDSFTYTVSDGKGGLDTATVTITITGVNDAPILTGQATALSTPEETGLALTLSNLAVTDVDNTYPTGFTLAVQPGANYEVSGNTITPALNYNGDLTVPVVVNDGSADSNTFSLTISVTAVNDAPVIAEQEVLSTPEETELTLTLSNLMVTDVDNTYPVGFTLTVRPGANYQVSGNTITPALNFNGDLTVPVVVNDGSADSNVRNMVITVTPVNDAPAVTSAAVAEVTQGFPYSYVVAGTDVEDPASSLNIDQAASSLLPWMQVSGKTITGTPTSTGSFPVSIVITDGQSRSTPQTFNLTVHPALEIVEDSIDVTVDGTTFEANDEINVSPGELVSIQFDYLNHIDFVVGYVTISAVSDQVPDFVDYEKEDVTILPGVMTSSDTFAFTVPNGIDADQFTVTLSLADGAYNYQRDVTFNVVRSRSSAVLNSVTINDANLTCMKKPILSVNLTNTGNDALEPDVWVFDQQPEFDAETGTFDLEPLARLHATDSVDTGEEAVLSVLVDASELTQTTNLYVYVYSPYFWSAEEGFSVAGPSSTVTVRPGSCLVADNINEELSTFRGNEDTLSLDLLAVDEEGEYLYLNEDKDYSASLAFSIPEDGQTNPELVNCTVAGSVLSCNLVDDTRYGDSEVALQITESVSGSRVKENFTIDVRRTMEISDLSVNGADVEERLVSPEVKPLQDVALSFTLNNYLDLAITNIEVELSGNEELVAGFEPVEAFNLPSARAQTVEIAGKIPAATAVDEYDLTVEVTGQYLEGDYEIGDSYSFSLNVVENVEGAAITETAWTNEKNETYCNQNLGLDVEYTNAGTHTVSDVKIKVKDASGKINVSQERLSLAQGANATAHFDFNTEELPVGTRPLTVELSYNNDFSRDTETVQVEKHACFLPPTVTLSEDDADGLAGEDALDLSNATWTPSSGVEGLEETVTYNLVSNDNEDLIECSLTAAGLLTCAAPTPEESGTAKLNLTLTAGTTINEAEITVAVGAVNDAPRILVSSLGPFEEGAYYEMDLSLAVSDVDTQLTALTFSEDSANLQSVAATAAGKLKITPVSADFNTARLTGGVERFNLTVSDGVNQTRQEVALTVNNDNGDSASITAKSPAASAQSVLNNHDLTLNITVDNSDERNIATQWSVDNVVVAGATANSYTFNRAEGKTYTVKAAIVEASVELDSESWTITVTDKPYSSAFTLPVIGANANLANFADFSVESSRGKVAFTQPVNLDEIGNLDPLITINDNQVAIDSSTASGLGGRTATVTLKKTFTNPQIEFSEGFNAGNFTSCPSSRCTIVSKANGQFVFTVARFSTYRVAEVEPAALTLPSEVFFDNVARKTDATANITVRNGGSQETLSGLRAEFVGVSPSYSARTTGLPATLAAGAEATVTVQITVQEDEDAGKNSIGSLKISGTNGFGQQVSKEIPIYVKPQTFLKIDKVEINGKTAGKLNLQENEIAVKVKNNYKENLEDVIVTVTIIDVDGSDLKEESEEFELSDGKSKELKLTFDLTDEDLTEESYSIEVEVEGTEEDDGTDHGDSTEKDVEVDRDNHKVILKKAELSSGTLKCSTQGTLFVTVKNIGNSNEDEIEITAVNSGLGLDAKKSHLELDKYSGSDNEYKASFPIDARQAEAEVYPITVTVNRDGKQVDTTEVKLTVEECVTSRTTTQTTSQYTAGEDLTALIQQQLQQRASQQTVPQPAQPQATISFRDSTAYLILLGVVAALLFVAVVLGLAVLVLKRR